MFVHVIDDFGLLACSRPEDTADNLSQTTGELDWGGEEKRGKPGDIKTFANQLQGGNKDLDLAPVQRLYNC